MRPVKTDRDDNAGLLQIVRTGWFKQVRIKSRSNCQIRSLLTFREMLLRTRVRIGNELRRLLRAFGVLFGKRVGSFAARAGAIILGELDASPDIRLVAEMLIKTRASILDQIKVLDRR
jgi:transposase